MQRIFVNGQPISPEAIQFELERLVHFYAQHGMPEDQIRKQLPQLQKQATDQALGSMLLMIEANKLDIPVSEDEIDQQIKTIIGQIGGQEAFDKALAERKTSLADFRQQLKRGRRVDKLVERVTAGAKDPTEAEIRQHFEDHRSEYEKGERVLAQHILITPDGDTDTSKAEARAKIAAIRRRIVDEGKNFSDEAAAHSMCPSGKEGGSLGWFSRGMMVPEFDKAAFEMRDGEVSDIIETQFGYHIIYKTAHEDAQAADFDDVREQIRDFLRHNRKGELMAAYVNELRAKANVEVRDDGHTHSANCQCHG
ncbi:MAG: peptidylprolyl isomerase [Kiritimatiellae bacterium]|nr:peptidylprolyl isomerase [Kiritimatiellia bacterium]